jgi:SAM-dependent methyltransferase
MSLAGRVIKYGAHAVLGNRKWLTKELVDVRRRSSPNRILEIGSGKPVGDRYPYSMQHLFPGTEFLCTDIVPDYGHTVVDVTRMQFDNEFDLILCISVLEHVVKPSLAATRLTAALRDGGCAVVAVPFVYPLHDEPYDFWRFTEHGLREVLSPFSSVEIRRRGPRKLPSGLLALAWR